MVCVQCLPSHRLTLECQLSLTLSNITINIISSPPANAGRKGKRFFISVFYYETSAKHSYCVEQRRAITLKFSWLSRLIKLLHSVQTAQTGTRPSFRCWKSTQFCLMCFFSSYDPLYHDVPAEFGEQFCHNLQQILCWTASISTVLCCC